MFFRASRVSIVTVIVEFIHFVCKDIKLAEILEFSKECFGSVFSVEEFLT